VFPHLYLVLVDVSMNNSLLYVSRASDFGLMKIDDTGRIVSFSEKPKGDDLKAMVSWIFSPSQLSCSSYATQFKINF